VTHVLDKITIHHFQIKNSNYQK